MHKTRKVFESELGLRNLEEQIGHAEKVLIYNKEVLDKEMFEVRNIQHTSMKTKQINKQANKQTNKKSCSSE